MTKYTAAELAEDRELLRSWISPGDVVTTISHGRGSSDGPLRLSVAIVRNGLIQDITAPVAHLIGVRYNADKGWLSMGGWGMDMGFSVVYSLGRGLFTDDEVDAAVTRNAGQNRDAGYMLTHRWF